MTDPSEAREGHQEKLRLFIKRLRLAWRFKVWPWSVPWQAVKYVALDQRLTVNDIARAHELAAQYGWEKGTMSQEYLPDEAITKRHLAARQIARREIEDNFRLESALAAAREEVEQLRKERDEAEAKFQHWGTRAVERSDLASEWQDRAEAAEAAVSRLQQEKETMRGFARHRSDCPAWICMECSCPEEIPESHSVDYGHDFKPRVCTCGLAALLDTVKGT